MFLRPIRVAAPAMPVVSLDEFRQYVRNDFNDDDNTLEALLRAATDHVDGYAGTLGRCLINQTWRVDFAGWPSCSDILLPFGDVSQLTSVIYVDAAGVEQTVNSPLYERLETVRGSLVRFREDFTFPDLYEDRSDRVSVTFVAGYGPAPSDVPPPIRIAIMMLAAHWNENREGQGAVPPAVEALLQLYRRFC